MTTPTGPRRLSSPKVLIRDFLAEAEADALLDWAVANEGVFQATNIVTQGVSRHDTGLRRSVAVRAFEPIESVLRKRALARFPEIVADLKVSPIRVDDVELELVAHGDGAFYTRHVDTAALPHQGGFGVRVVSAVYYAFRHPRAFTGGALRLFPFGTVDDEDWLDIEPEHNALLAFPSWAPHEVRPVSCPSGRFEDCRFAVNIWFRTIPNDGERGR